MCYYVYNRRSKRREKYRYLALYFAMILVIFTQFSSKNVEQTGKFRRKNRSFCKCYEN